MHVWLSHGRSWRQAAPESLEWGEDNRGAEIKQETGARAAQLGKRPPSAQVRILWSLHRVLHKAHRSAGGLLFLCPSPGLCAHARALSLSLSLSLTHTHTHATTIVNCGPGLDPLVLS